MAVRSTHGQNRAVRSTQGGRGVSPSEGLYLVSELILNYVFSLHFTLSFGKYRDVLKQVRVMKVRTTEVLDLVNTMQHHSQKL